MARQQHLLPAEELELSAFVDGLAQQLKLPEHIRQALHQCERFKVEANKPHGTVRISYVCVDAARRVEQASLVLTDA